MRLRAFVLVMQHRPQVQIALLGTESGLGLGQLQVTLPESARICLPAVGAHQIRPVRLMRPRSPIQLTAGIES